MTVQPTELPFLAGRNSFVERIAQLDQWVRFDAKAMMINGGQIDTSWAEIRDAAFKAIEAAGNEIAKAKTSAEAATATLRRDTYSDGLRDIDANLLRIGKKHLQKGPILAYPPNVHIGFIAYGRRSIGGPLERIPAAHWEAGNADWDEWRLKVLDGTLWTGIRILDLVDVPPDIQEKLAARADCPSHETARTGGPGRPTSIHLVEREFERRIQANQVKERVGLQAAALREWFIRTHPDLPPPEKKTIENRIRSSFNKAKQRSS